LQARLTAYYARDFAVMQSLGIPNVHPFHGFASSGTIPSFCGATHVWGGPARSSVRDVINNDAAAMWADAAKELLDHRPWQLCFHLDVWTDIFNRPTLGGMVGHLGSHTWTPKASSSVSMT